MLNARHSPATIRLRLRPASAQLNAQDLAPRPLPEPGLLDAYGDDETITDKARTALGRELHADQLPYL
jgi:hypothetical protein